MVISNISLSAKYDSIVQIWLLLHNFEKHDIKETKNDDSEGFHDIVKSAVNIFFLNFINATRKYQFLTLKCIFFVLV